VHPQGRRGLEAAGAAGEIVVADNGSTDGSQEIARRLGARVVPVAARGYGAALMGGIAAARGRFIIMGDADDSYDFGEIPKFVDKLREGFALVQGCRLPAGGGTVCPERCPCCTGGGATPCSRCSCGAGSARPCTTSTAACEASGRATTRRSTSAARGWSSPPR
jgi:glycosyltransferase involved in cell wall biosynthesis